MRLWTELRRRNVFRVAAAYALVGWLLIEVADTVFPRLGLPDWTVTFVIAAVIVGVPLALVLAWAFELTPEGIKRETRLAPGTQPIRRRSGRRIDRLIVLGLTVVIALLVVERVWLARRGGSPTPAQEVGAAPGAASQPEASADKSVAVLPFVNMSSDPENEYFADGISEEILNLLAQLQGLRVAGRTSSFQFKNHQEDLRRIGERLGVTHILEGSVRKSGDRVRITAQLIQTDDGFHVWSEAYNRELTDVFAVQDEIAGAILQSMKIELLGDPAEPHIATTSVEAYTLYLKAQSFLAKRGTDNLHAARELFEQSIALDSVYVPALVGLARTLALTPSYAGLSGERAAELTRAAVAAARRALDLNPDNAGAFAVLGTVYTFYDWRWRDAEEAFSRALALAPNDAEIVNFAGDYYRAARDPVRMIEVERHAIDLDPLHPVNHWDLAWAYLGLGEHEQAIAYARTANSLSPESLDPYSIMVWSFGALGRFDEMNAALAEARRNTHEEAYRYLLLDAWAAIAEGRRTEALGLLEQIEPYAQAGDMSNAFLGFSYVLLGESERAAYWLQRAYERHDVQLAFSEPVDLWLIDSDPKARVILERPALRELFEIRKSNR